MICHVRPGIFSMLLPRIMHRNTSMKFMAHNVPGPIPSCAPPSTFSDNWRVTDFGIHRHSPSWPLSKFSRSQSRSDWRLRQRGDAARRRMSKTDTRKEDPQAASLPVSHREWYQGRLSPATAICRVHLAEGTVCSHFRERMSDHRFHWLEMTIFFQFYRGYAFTLLLHHK